MLCQGALAVMFWSLAATDPLTAIGSFAILAVIAAFLSATQDVVIDAWRIEIADETATVDLLSAIYQLGNRFAALTGVALALVLAARLSWPMVYVGFGFVMLGAVAMTLFTPEIVRETADEESPLAGHRVPEKKERTIALGIVAVCWIWAIFMLGNFMAAALAPVVPGVVKMTATEFTKIWGPWIIVATVIIPAIVSAWTSRVPQHVEPVGIKANGAQAAANHSYRALILPLAEIVSRLRWGAILVLALILLYRIADSIWAPFAFPFYLDFLHYTNDEVAIASKIVGVLMTTLGVVIGGIMLATIGRMPTLLAGGVVAAASNLLFADLAAGGAGIDAFMHLFMLDSVGVEPRMMRLLIGITGENIAGGLAGTAFIAYISSIVSREYSAVQYALLSSMTFLVGALGRASIGEAIEIYGYANVFLITAGLGMIAVVLVAIEWARGPREPADPVLPVDKAAL